MTTLDIYNLLEKKIHPDEFQKNYIDEIKKYEKQIKKIGSSVTILVDEDYGFIFKKNYLINICNFYLTNSLQEIEINYLVDCITLSNTIELDSNLFDILETFTDPEINGILSKEYILKIITELNDI